METLDLRNSAYLDWKSCNFCNIHIHKKDVYLHQKHCTTQPLHSLPHGYICNNTLFAVIYVLKGKSSIPVSIQPLVFIHPSTMKLFKFGMGDAIILSHGDTTAAFHVYPNCKIHHASISFPYKQDITFSNRGHISLHHYIDFFKPANVASELQVFSKNPMDFMQSYNFKNSVRQQHRGAFVHCGRILTVQYMGTPCELEISQIRESCARTTTREVGNINENSSELLNLDIQNENESTCFLDRTQRLIEDSTRHIKCSTPVSTKKIPISISTPANDVSFISFCGKNNSSECLHNHSVVSPKTVISSQAVNQSCLWTKKTFNNIGGLKKQLKTIKKLLLPFLSPDMPLHDENLPKGIILLGPSGTGKSLVLDVLASESQVPVFNLHRADIFNQAPCLLILDDVHTLYRKDKFDQLTVNERSVIDELPRLIENLPNVGRRRVVVVAATSKYECLDSVLIRRGRFEKEINFDIPDAKERKEILEKLLSNTNQFSEEQIADVINSSHGFTGADLQKMCQKAHIIARLMYKGKDMEKKEERNHIITRYPTYTDFVCSLKVIRPTVMKQFTVEVQKVYWKDIGGMGEVKQEIMDMIDLPIRHPEAFQASGITQSHGILMYGPPGCSKTMIAKAVATESQLNFLSVKGPELFNKFVGESEAAIRNLFKKAKASIPCVIFFDEIDSLAAERGNFSNGSNVGERILTQLLTEIDGIDIKKGICIIAATNRPDLIDSAFLRPGRFDSVVYVPLPDTLTRQEILQIKLKDVPLSNDIDIKYLVETTEGYTGAEIISICDEAAMMVAFKDMQSAMSSVITMSCFEEALKHIKPRTSKELLVFYESFKAKYCRVQTV